MEYDMHYICPNCCERSLERGKISPTFNGDKINCVWCNTIFIVQGNVALIVKKPWDFKELKIET